VVADLVFRRLGSPADFSRAYRLLGACEPRCPDEAWSGPVETVTVVGPRHLVNPLAAGAAVA
jgi:hypothetical protein